MATAVKGIFKPIIQLKDEEGQNPLDAMVILVHVLRRYLTEIAKKPKYVVDDFFQGVRGEINQSIKHIQGENDLATFSKFVELLNEKHKWLLKGIFSSTRMRKNERRAIKRIYMFAGSDKEIQQLLKMLNTVKKDEAFRKQIDNLVTLMNMEQPVSAVTPPKFDSYLWNLYKKSNNFKRMLLHIFEKAATSQRMSKLMATILLALSKDKTPLIIKEIYPDLLNIEGNNSGFINIYTNFFLARDTDEVELDYLRRISVLFRLKLNSDIFLEQFSYLPPNKLRPAKNALANILKSLIASRPDFLHLLTQKLFVDAPGDILPRIPLELVRRGLVAIYDYTGQQADDYLEKFTASITFYYEIYLPPDKKEQSHFYLMISALNKYVAELLEAVYKKKVFRDSEIETWMPLLNAIRLFHKTKDKEAKAKEIWDLLVQIRQKKETRDQLTLMNDLSSVSSGTYLKELVPFITQLTTDKEKFRLIFDYLFVQTRVDKQKFESTIAWHANLLNNIVRYLSDISIVSDASTRPLLNNLIRGLLFISKTYVHELIELLSEKHLASIRDLISYLYTHFQETLGEVVKSMIKLTEDDYKDDAAAFIQYIHTFLLGQARLPDKSPADTQQKIENVKQLFDNCIKDIGELRQHWDSFIFSDAYKMSISNLLKVEVRVEENIFESNVKSSDKRSILPSLILSLIHQSEKIYNVPNFAERAIASFSEITEWAVDEMQHASKGSASLLGNVSRLYNLFSENYRFPQVSSNSVIHNFANKNEFDYFSFPFLIYAVAKVLDWDEILFRNSWRDVTVTVNTGAEDLELKTNMIINSKAMINNKTRFFKELNQLFKPLKAEIAIQTFFHLKNGIALADTRRYRLASLSLEKAIDLHRTNIYAHYWRAIALKKAKTNLAQYEKHISVIEKYYPNSTEVENLKKTSF